MNEDFNLGLSFITKEGLLKDEGERKALLGRITVDIDQFFEKLDYVDGSKLKIVHYLFF